MQPTNTQDTEAERERLADDLAQIAEAVRSPGSNMVAIPVDMAARLLSALRREPGSEPVAWLAKTADGGASLWVSGPTLAYPAPDDVEVFPVYATEPPAPVVEPVGMDEFEGLVDEYLELRDAACDVYRYSGPGPGYDIIAAKEDAARTALLDAYRRGGAVGGDEAREVCRHGREPNETCDPCDFDSEADRLRARLRDIRAFAKAHHNEEPAHVWLHGLTIDIPSMIDRALDAHVLSRPSGSGEREALEKIVGMKDQTVFSQSRADMDGNEAFMLGANTAFEQTAAIAERALAVQPEKEER